MPDNPTRPEWLARDEQVVIYTETGRDSGRSVTLDIVTKVDALRFTVSGGNQFRVSDGALCDPFNRYGFIRYAIPLTSPEGYAEIARDARERRMINAQDGSARWQRSLSREDRLAAIEALQALDGDGS